MEIFYFLAAFVSFAGVLAFRSARTNRLRDQALAALAADLGYSFTSKVLAWPKGSLVLGKTEAVRLPLGGTRLARISDVRHVIDVRTAEGRFFILDAVVGPRSDRWTTVIAAYKLPNLAPTFRMVHEERNGWQFAWTPRQTWRSADSRPPVERIAAWLRAISAT